MIVDIFNPIQKKKLIIRIAGKEYLGKHTSKVVKKLINQPETFKSFKE